MLALKYERVDLKKSFDVFRFFLINYTIKESNNSNYVLVLVQDMEYPKASFDTKNGPKYLNETEAKSEFKKYVLDERVRKYIEREGRLVSNMKKSYGIIWGHCTPGLQSVLKGNEDFLSKSKVSTCYGSCRRPRRSL